MLAHPLVVQQFPRWNLVSLRSVLLALIAIVSLRGMVLYHSEGWEERLPTTTSHMHDLRRVVKRNVTVENITKPDMHVTNKMPHQMSDIQGNAANEAHTASHNTAEHPHDGVSTMHASNATKPVSPRPFVAADPLRKHRLPSRTKVASTQGSERFSMVQAVSDVSDEYRELVKIAYKSERNGKIVLVGAGSAELTFLLHWLIHLDMVSSCIDMWDCWPELMNV
jgi:hypothetical protein